MQIHISFRSRSDLVLDADHAFDFLSYLVLQACISLCSVSDTSGASLFLPCSHKIRHRKGAPNNFCDKDFAELSGALSGAICLKTLVLLGSALELFRKFFGTVRAIFWVWGSFLAWWELKGGDNV